MFLRFISVLALFLTQVLSVSAQTAFKLHTPTALQLMPQSSAFQILSNGDLMAIQKQGGNQRTEVHILSQASNFQTFSLQKETALHPTDDNWDFVILDNRDLIAISKNGGSNTTEIHILDASNSYDSFKLHTDTALHPTDSNWDFGANAAGDVFGINRKGGSGKTEIHILDSATGYKTFKLHVSTALHKTDDNWDFGVLPNGDVVAINRLGGSNTTEVHVLDASTNYQTFKLQSPTALHRSDASWKFAVRNNGDVYAIQTQNSVSGKTEIYTFASNQTVQPGNVPKGRYRAVINGFSVTSPTWDHALEVDGKGDEVYIAWTTTSTDKNGNKLGGTFGDRTIIMGDTHKQNNRIKAGSLSKKGGLTAGDTYPEGGTPWALDTSLVDPQNNRPPIKAWEGELIQGETSVVIVPSIWEWDGGSDAFGGWVTWASNMFNQVKPKAQALAQGNATSDYIIKGADIGLTIAVSMKEANVLGQAKDRPIGMKKSNTNPKEFEYEAQALMLNYDTAEFLTKNDPLGRGNGVVAFSFDDDNELKGKYLLYIQVQKIE